MTQALYAHMNNKKKKRKKFRSKMCNQNITIVRYPSEIIKPQTNCLEKK
jgi:hypothetical protein